MRDGMSFRPDDFEETLREASSIVADLARLGGTAGNGLAILRSARLEDPASVGYHRALTSGAFVNGANHVTLEHDYSFELGQRLLTTARSIIRTERVNEQGMKQAD